MASFSCDNQEGTSGLSEVALKTLYKVLHEQQGFIKVHAAEYLIWTGHKETPKTVYLKEDSLYKNVSPYRIGIWRVLAQAEKDSSKRSYWKNKILNVFADSTAPDRLHACETLAKLGYSPLEKYPQLTKKELSSPYENMRLYALWAVSSSSDSAFFANRKIFLETTIGSKDVKYRKIAAYILQKTGSLSPEVWDFFAQKALAEPEASGLRTDLLNTALVTWQPRNADSDLYRSIQAQLYERRDSFSLSEKMNYALMLAEKGRRKDLAFLDPLLDYGTQKQDSAGQRADLAATAAYAILRIEGRDLKK